MDTCLFFKYIKNSKFTRPIPFIFVTDTWSEIYKTHFISFTNIWSFSLYPPLANTRTFLKDIHTRTSTGYRRLHRRNQPSLPSCYNFPTISPEKPAVIRRLFIIHIKDGSGEKTIKNSGKKLVFFTDLVEKRFVFLKI
ncbi:hypothetical protein Hanom_Chr04g00309591 [Helianthus anomalus]